LIDQVLIVFNGQNVLDSLVGYSTLNGSMLWVNSDFHDPDDEFTSFAFSSDGVHCLLQSDRFEGLLESERSGILHFIDPQTGTVVDEYVLPTATFPTFSEGHCY